MWHSTQALPLAPGLVEVVLRVVVARGQVALRADRVALGAQRAAVRVVAVAAGHARAVHPALQERAPDVDLVALLAVGVVQAGREQRRRGSGRGTACPAK